MIAKRIGECGTIPLGYGVAYFDALNFSYVCLPLGLHAVVALARRAYYVFMKLGASDPAAEAFAAGYSQGFKVGSHDEYLRGYKDGREIILQQLENDLTRKGRGV